MRRVFLFGMLCPLVISGAGCSLAPRSFRDMIHPAPVVRARAVGLGDDQPEWVAVPALIDRLNDPDRVVRMASSDALKARTGRDFGFLPWAPPEERAQAVERWRAWWKQRQQAAYPNSGTSTKVATRPARTRRRADPDVQGGPNPSWPANPSPTPQPPSS